MNPARCFLFAFTCLASIQAFAEDAEAAKPATAARIYEATDLASLRDALNKEVTVEGSVVMQGQNPRETVRYLNFAEDYKTALGLVFFLNYSEGGSFTKEKLGEYVGKKVRVIGKLEEYNGAVQIKINKMDQIQVLE